MFSDVYILKFLDFHIKFTVPEEVIKIFILSRRFRLTLIFIERLKVKFEIDFFIMAIESGSFSTAFALLRAYEELIIKNIEKPIDTLVKSFSLNNEFIRSKLHMVKLLLHLFNFKNAKQFLVQLEFQLNDSSIEGCPFSRTNNPLLVLGLLHEILLNFSQKFFSLNNLCRSLINRLLNIALIYIDSVDDENFLTTIMLERDFTGRDPLRIFVEYEILELI